jgi:hypothetical protein
MDSGNRVQKFGKGILEPLVTMSLMILQQASYFLENGDFRVGRGYVAVSWRLSTLSRYLASQKLDLTGFTGEQRPVQAHRTSGVEFRNPHSLGF